MQSMGKRKHREEKVGQDTWKGSYTVEAAVILPLTALILAAVILAAFYIHDRSCMQGMACEIASAGSNCITQEQRTKRVAQLRQEVKPEDQQEQADMRAGIQAVVQVKASEVWCRSVKIGR